MSQLGANINQHEANLATLTCIIFDKAYLAKKKASETGAIYSKPPTACQQRSEPGPRGGVGEGNPPCRDQRVSFIGDQL